MTKTISKAEFLNSVGTVYGPGEWFKVDQDRINKFAEATDDFQFIHVDPERAAKETKTEVTVEIKGEDKPALIVEWLGMTFLGE